MRIFHIGATIAQSGFGELYTKIIHVKSPGRRSFQFFISPWKIFANSRHEFSRQPLMATRKNRRDTGTRASTCGPPNKSLGWKNARNGGKLALEPSFMAVGQFDLGPTSGRVFRGKSAGRYRVLSANLRSVFGDFVCGIDKSLSAFFVLC